MDENTVLKEQLTEAMIRAGAELTRKLDEVGLPVVAALWLFDPEINEWRLLFASPDVATEGPTTVYRRIRQALEQLGDKSAASPLSVITVREPDADLIRRLKTAISTGPGGVASIRFSKNVVNGHYIEDALIYRVA